MLSVSNLSVQFGKRVLFDDVNVTFLGSNCYGIIGANGAGKSTFLKIISGQQESNSGSVFLEPGKRLSVLEQNHNAFDEYTVLDTILRGNQELYKVKAEMDSIYAKKDFSDADGERVGELQVIFEEIEDLKNHFNLGKKNWFQLLKGKVVDLTLKKILNKTIVQEIYNQLSEGFEQAVKMIE